MIQKGTGPFCTFLVETAKGGVGVVVLKDLAVGVALGGHYGGSYLAETYSVSPTCSAKCKSCKIALFIDVFDYYERTAEQVRFGQGTTDFKFLSYFYGTLCSLNLQLINTSRRPAFYGAQINDIAYIHTRFAAEYVRYLSSGVLHRPTVEIRSLQVVAVE